MEVKLKISLKPILISLFIILLTLELIPFILGSFFLEEGYSRKKIKSELKGSILVDTATILEDESAESYLSEHIVHPYLGFIHHPNDYYNKYGFPAGDPMLVNENNSVNVCIMGGSVAKQLFQVSGEYLIEKLKLYPSFTGKTINLVCLSLGGFKQPQQLLTLNYMMSLGASYDYVINIDGFNEVVLPYSDNLPFGIHPSFPRHWNVYSRKILDKSIIQLLGIQAYVKQQQQQRNKSFSTSVFRQSNFGLFVWKLMDRESDIKILESENNLRNEISNSTMEIQTSGPEFPVVDTLSFFSNQVSYWAKCSKQMNGLAQNFGFNYLHFLQPNQYLPGSKKLNKEELRIAFEEGDFAYKNAVEIAYPMLIDRGELLTQEGIKFKDLTQIFSSETSTVYADKCCHFNKKGYDAIADQIASAMTSQPQ